MRSRLFMVLGILFYVGIVGCHNEKTRVPQQYDHVQESGIEDLGTLDNPATINKIHLDLGVLTSEEWVDCFLPSKSQVGFNLVLYRRQVPMLIDMNGRIVHSWPMVRVVGRMRLSKQGKLTVIGRDNVIKEYDWDGRLTWAYKSGVDGDFPHHDFIEAEDGGFLIVFRRASHGTDDIRHVDRSGQVVWEWRSDQHLETDFLHFDRNKKDSVHINSIRLIPENRYFSRGDDRFRPGNILVSARNLERIFVIDRESGEVVWQFGRGLDYQHEAIMAPRGHLFDGRIFIFNNGYKNLESYRQSSVVAIDPFNGMLDWEYRASGFFSSVAGAQQLLSNGNVLITSSEAGRVFEVTASGEIVWQWVPPYLPMRVLRYAPDHCPQLARFGSQDLVEMPMRRTYPFIDLELYSFTIPDEQRRIKIHGRNRWVFPHDKGCRELWLPPQPSFVVNYGLHDGLLSDHELSVRFRVVMTSNTTGEMRVLLDDVVVSSDEFVWRERRQSLQGLGLQRVTMCIEATCDGEVSEEEAAQIIVWGKPIISSKLVRTHREGRPPLPATVEEEAQRMQQLEALGYVQ